MSSSKTLTIRPINHWGFQKFPHTSIQSVGTNDVIYALGNRISIYNDVEQTSTPIYTKGVTAIQYMKVSKDLLYFAVAVTLAKPKESKPSIHILIYDMHDFKDNNSKYKTIVYEYEQRQNMNLKVNTIAFSKESDYIAVSTNVLAYAVLLFDRAIGTLVQTIPIMNSVVYSVTFNPSDSSRLCTTGSKSLFELWKYTNKSSFNSHIVGLHNNTAIKGQVTYTSHVWLPESRLVAGTNTGFLALVQSGELQNQVRFPFGTSSQQGHAGRGIVNLLARDDLIFATSDANHIAILEVKKMASSTGSGITAMLVPCIRMQFTDIKNINGFQWRSRVNETSTEAYISSDSGLYVIDLKGNEYRQVMGNDVSSSSRRNWCSNDPSPVCEWASISSDRKLRSFHSKGVTCSSIARRRSVFATLSIDDALLMIWDCNKTNSVVTDSYAGDRAMYQPQCISMHPLGTMIALGCEDDVRECIITEKEIVTVKTIPTKQPFNSTSGTPVVNTQPVTCIVYSSGGHLLAIATGKIIQVYHMLSLEYLSPESIGTPKRVYAFADNTAPIADVCFSHDDSLLYTTSLDGYIYCYSMTSGERIDEYCCSKVLGVNGSKVCTSTDNSKSIANCTIIAYCETDSLTISKTGNVRRGRMNSLALNRSSSYADIRQSMHRSVSSGSIDASYDIGTNLDAAAAAVQTNMLLKSSQPNQFIANSETTDSGRALLCVWNGKINSAPEIIHLHCGLSSITLGMTAGAFDRQEMCVMGCNDGRIIVSVLPLPLQVISTTVLYNNIELPYATSSDKINCLNESMCKTTCTHTAYVSNVHIASSGSWVMSSGNDGYTYLYTTNHKSKELSDIVDFNNKENTILAADKTSLQQLRRSIEISDHTIEELHRDYDRKLSKLKILTDQNISSQDIKLSIEIKKRDDIIIRVREENAKTMKKFIDDKNELIKKYEHDISQLEVYYETKLTNESLYLSKMRQAYEEFVLHSRMDLQDYQKQTILKEGMMQQDKSDIVAETEKQKAAILQYVEYVNNRHSEILFDLETNQTYERTKLKQDLKAASIATESVNKQKREEYAKFHKKEQDLRSYISDKEKELLSYKSDLEWSQGRIHRLEQALTESTDELKRKDEQCEKSEYRIGDQQQQLYELEKVRKALTTQLHILRQEIAPKELKLSHATERMQDMDREYELALNAIAQKEESIAQQASSVHLLQKQVRELRHATSRKDGILRRAAVLFDEYMHSLQQANFNSYKKTVAVGAFNIDSNGSINLDVTGTTTGNGTTTGTGTTAAVAGGGSIRRKANGETEMIEIIAKSASMERSLQRIKDVLLPYTSSDTVDFDLDKEVSDSFIERERHVQLLHKNVDGLKHSLEHTSLVAHMKLSNQMNDNTTLLQDVNAMRYEIRQLSMENQMLKSQKKLDGMKHKTMGKSVGVSTGIGNTQTSKHAVSSTGPESRSNTYVDNTTATTTTTTTAAAAAAANTSNYGTTGIGLPMDDDIIDGDSQGKFIDSEMCANKKYSDSVSIDEVSNAKIDEIFKLNALMIANANSNRSNSNSIDNSILSHHQNLHKHELAKSIGNSSSSKSSGNSGKMNISSSSKAIKPGVSATTVKKLSFPAV